MNNKIAGVVVLYEPPMSVLKNILTYSNELQKLYVIDNSITSDRELVDQLILIDKIEYVNNNGNKGIANALNQGCNKAIADGFTWLLTMDQDSAFYQNQFLKFISLLNTDDEQCSKIGIFSPYHIVENGNANQNTSEYERIKVSMTSGNILNLKAFISVGSFKDDLFIDYVDHEYCLRLRKHGYEILQCNKICLEHRLGNSKHYKILRMTATHHNFIRRYYITRNRLYVIWTYKNFDTMYCIRECFFMITDLIKIVLVEKDKFLKIRSMALGLKDFLIGKYGQYLP